MLLPASSGSSGVGTSTNIFREGIHSSSRKNSNVTLTGEVERRSSHDRPNAPRLRVGGSSGLHVDCDFFCLMVGLEHQYPEEYAKDQNHQEKCQGNEKEDFGNASGARRDIRKTEETRDNRYDKKYGCPFEHNCSFQDH